MTLILTNQANTDILLYMYIINFIFTHLVLVLPQWTVPVLLLLLLYMAQLYRSIKNPPVYVSMLNLCGDYLYWATLRPCGIQRCMHWPPYTHRSWTTYCMVNKTKLHTKQKSQWHSKTFQFNLQITTSFNYYLTWECYRT